ncbi:MAG TPA: DUF72 domain-containing protein [Myxococcaceae bacterium]|nr:DUF72 domain-containing protein [Myxococcaceae bacterium]
MEQLTFGMESSPGRPIRNIYYGTCSWTDPTLLQSKAFYPSTVTSAADRLRFYAQSFPLVEVDSTFYAPPSEENAIRWADRTPNGFLFNIKAYGLLTHHAVAVRSLPLEIRRILKIDEEAKNRIYMHELPIGAQQIIWDMHVQALQPLAQANKLGALLLQFPYWFFFSRRHIDYLREASDRLPWRLAIEFRGGQWMEENNRRATLSLLEELGLTYVIVDEPQGFKSSTPPVVAVTSELAMLRFHGRNRKTWEAPVKTTAERFNYLYNDEELKPWAVETAKLSRDTEMVHVLWNNNYRDYPIRNARQFAELLKEAD